MRGYVVNTRLSCPLHSMRSRPSLSFHRSGPFTAFIPPNFLSCHIYRLPPSVRIASHRIFSSLLSHHIAIMKPIVGAFGAWSCFIISLFAVVILSVIGSLFQKNHHAFTGSTDDPADGPAVASSIFIAVLVYAAFAAFCGLQTLLHARESRSGAISLG